MQAALVKRLWRLEVWRLLRALREPAEACGLKFAAENGALSSQNTFFGNERVDEARA